MLMMDDEAIDNFFRRGMGTITGSSLGMEGMAEFQILTNTYGAQFGGMGAVMNAVSPNPALTSSTVPPTCSCATAPWTRAASSTILR